MRLVRGLVGLSLALLGSLAAVVLFARLLVNPAWAEATRLMVDTGSAWPLPPLNGEARALYPQLKARVEEINRPVSADPGLAPFRVAQGETALSVAANLQTAGLISDAALFVQLLTYNGLDTRLQAGDYQLRRNMTMRQIAAALYRGRSMQRIASVPPGWRLEQLADYLSTAGLMDGDLFLRQARQGLVVNHPLLADRPTGQSYEGYLFPGDYPLPDEATPADLIGRMLDHLASQLPPDVLSQARQRGLTFYQVLTLASIVERETGQPEERPLVASVYLNRLKPGSAYPYLQADPTVQYALGYQPAGRQWWQALLTVEQDISIDSRYNTYRYPGLPPGPIASPGLASIMAVLQPAKTDYLFFVCRRPVCEGGQHVFARTYEEHLQNARVYWGEK